MQILLQFKNLNSKTMTKLSKALQCINTYVKGCLPHSKNSKEWTLIFFKGVGEEVRGFGEIYTVLVKSPIC